MSTASRTLSRSRIPGLISQFARFCVVGVGNTLITLLVFHLLDGAGAPYLAASVVGFLAGALNGYGWNRAWTFRRPGSPWRFGAVQLLGLGLNVALLAALVDGLGAPHLFAQACVLPVVSAATFLASRELVFRGS